MLGWVKRACSERRMHSRAVLEHACIQSVYPCVISECVFLCVCLHAVICCIVFVGFMMTASRNTQHNKLCIAMRAHAQRESQLGPGAEIHEFFGASLQNLTIYISQYISHNIVKYFGKKVGKGNKCWVLRVFNVMEGVKSTRSDSPKSAQVLKSCLLCMCMYVCVFKR